MGSKQKETTATSNVAKVKNAIPKKTSTLYLMKGDVKTLNLETANQGACGLRETYNSPKGKKKNRKTGQKSLSSPKEGQTNAVP